MFILCTQTERGKMNLAYLVFNLCLTLPVSYRSFLTVFTNEPIPSSAFLLPHVFSLACVGALSVVLFLSPSCINFRKLKQNNDKLSVVSAIIQIV